MSSSILSKFWTFVVFMSIALVGVMLWRIHDANGRAVPPIAYDKFVGILDARKIQNATIYMGYDVSEIRASLQNSSNPIQADMPTQELPKLMKQMMDGGASVEIARARRFEPAEFVLNIVPYALMFVFAIVIVLMRKKVVA
jgi:hypothetical protein